MQNYSNEDTPLVKVQPKSDEQVEIAFHGFEAAMPDFFWDVTIERSDGLLGWGNIEPADRHRISTQFLKWILSQ